MTQKRIFKKLDKRNTGYGNWSYYIDRQYSFPLGLFESKQKFHSWRTWCWQTWGPSKELNEWLEDQRHPDSLSVNHNDHWCWQNDQFNTRIYLRSDKELSIFLLKWSQ